LTITKPQNATLIDSISEGYTAINRRPWLVLIPLVLNLYLWFGGQVSLAPLITSIANTLKSVNPAISEQGDMQAVYDQFLATGGVDLRQQLAVLNYIPTLRLYVVGGGDAGAGLPAIPEVLRLVNTQRTDTIQIGTFGGALLAFLIINTLALVLSAIFLGQVGAAVRRDWSPALALRRAAKIGVSLLGAVAIIVGVGLALGLPILFFATLLLYLNQTLGILALIVVYWVGIWISIYIGFTAEAIVISGLGPLRAIYTSFNVVRRNVWGTLGFLALTLVIQLGSGVLWHSLVNTLIGAIVAMVASAYIGSGLLAARMAFYRERLRRWQAATAQPPGLRARN
jgi:hypothetical protein